MNKRVEAYASAVLWWIRVLNAIFRSVIAIVMQASRPNAVLCEAPLRDQPSSDKGANTSARHAFKPINEPGFGDPSNTYAWSMSWWQDKLYVGTGRAYSCVLYWDLHRAAPWLQRYPPRFDLDSRCAEDPYDLPLQAEIWCYSLQTQSWDLVYQSPNDLEVPTRARTYLPRDIGYRDMVVFTESDGTEALYVAGVSARSVDGSMPPPRLLRITSDGQCTAVPHASGTALGQLDAVGFRSLVAHNGRLYVTAGSLVGPGILLEAENLAGGSANFRRITPAGMRVNEIVAFDGCLYLGLWHPYKGYTVVKAETSGTPPYTYIPVLPFGGGRPQPWRSWGVVSMVVFQEHLYVGTDCPAEIVRIDRNGQWDLVVGQPRRTPLGVKCPLSGMGDGFNYPLNMALQRMHVHDNCLYAGTANVSRKQRGVPICGPLFGRHTGFDLYASHDGIHFTAITRTGLDNPANISVRTFASTPAGLFLGTVNERDGTRVYLSQ